MRALGLDSARASDANPAAPGATRVRDVVHQSLAMQGQDWRSSRWAVGVRAPGVTETDVRAALNQGLVVRSWPMRGTVHLVAAEDIGWLQDLTNPRVLAGAAKRREFLGMSDAALEQVTEASLAALSGDAQHTRSGITRDELSAVWTDAGIAWKPNWRYHLIWWMCQNGLTTFGPVDEPAADQGSDPDPRIVLADAWIKNPRKLTGDDALAELAARYVGGRGAVTQKDLASWSGILAADAKRALNLAAESGAIVPTRRAEVSGAAGALWADPHHLEAATTSASPSADWWLLPAFDEHLLGYNIREPQLGPALLDRIIPARNGVFLATVVHDGRVVGTWRRGQKRKRSAGEGRESTALEITAFPNETIDTRALESEITRLADFYNLSFSQVTVS